MQRLNVFRCEKCGNIVEVMHVGGGTLVCCGQPMNLLTENTTDAAKEKHVPVIQRTDRGYKVSVGSVPHPMQAEHYIQWIELITDSFVYRKYLSPGAPPEAEFEVRANGVTAREHCNLHGLWKA